MGPSLLSCGAGVIGLPGTGTKLGRSAILAISGISEDSGFSIVAGSASVSDSFGGDTRSPSTGGAVTAAASCIVFLVVSIDSSAADSSFLSGMGLESMIGGRNANCFAPPPPIRIDGRVEAENARPFCIAARPTPGRWRSGKGNSSSLCDTSRSSCFLWRNLSRILFAVASSTELE